MGRIADDPELPEHEDEIKAIVATNPQALVAALDANERFRRDTTLGGIFHRGKISFRELERKNSLHVIIDGNRVSAHVDEISPLSCKPGDAGRYAFWRVVAHNISGMWADLGRRIHGRDGVQRCNLECEVVWVDDEPEGADDPKPSVAVVDSDCEHPHHH